MDTFTQNSNDKKWKATFKKEERLTSKKIIDTLFTEGDSFLSYPVKVVFIETKLPSKFPVQAAFSVGKRNFKRAVHRNLIKRKMRESYRLNKQTLYNSLSGKQVAVFFIFVGKEIPDFRQVNSSIEKGIKKLIAEIS